MVPKISLKQLYYFVAVAELGKVNAAAGSIPVSASAITEAIKHLELAVGSKLFDRGKDGMRLTYEGYRFLERAKTLLRLAEETTERFRADSERISGSLELMVSPSVTGYFLPGPLARFRRFFPDIAVTLRELEREEIEQRLKRGEGELAVMLVSNITLKRGIRVETLLRSERRLWCAADHEFADRDTVNSSDIREQTFILLDLDEARENIGDYLRSGKIEPAEMICTATTEAVRSLVAQGVGVTVLSDLLYRPWSLEGARILRKAVVEKPPPMNLGIVWPKPGTLSGPARLFADFLRRECKGIVSDETRGMGM